MNNITDLIVDFFLIAPTILSIIIVIRQERLMRRVNKYFPILFSKVGSLTKELQKSKKK